MTGTSKTPTLWVQPIVGVIRIYQRWLSAGMGRNCRYSPTCSTYAIHALTEHGLVRGAGLALRRLGRCHPLGGSGYDPVPAPKIEPR